MTPKELDQIEAGQWPQRTALSETCAEVRRCWARIQELELAAHAIGARRDHLEAGVQAMADTLASHGREMESLRKFRDEAVLALSAELERRCKAEAKVEPFRKLLAAAWQEGAEAASRRDGDISALGNPFAESSPEAATPTAPSESVKPTGAGVDPNNG